MKIDLEKYTKDIQHKLDHEKIGARDYGVYVNTLLNIQKQLEGRTEGKWWKDLRDLKEAFESLEEFEIDDRYKSIFESPKGQKKKQIFLAE
jgi:hypothetical protein